MEGASAQISNLRQMLTWKCDLHWEFPLTSFLVFLFKWSFPAESYCNVTSDVMICRNVIFGFAVIGLAELVQFWYCYNMNIMSLNDGKTILL